MNDGYAGKTASKRPLCCFKRLYSFNIWLGSENAVILHGQGFLSLSLAISLTPAMSSFSNGIWYMTAALTLSDPSISALSFCKRNSGVKNTMSGLSQAFRISAFSSTCFIQMNWLLQNELFKYRVWIHHVLTTRIRNNYVWQLPFGTQSVVNKKKTKKSTDQWETDFGIDFFTIEFYDFLLSHKLSLS